MVAEYGSRDNLLEDRETNSPDKKTAPQMGLKRNLGLFSSVSLILGTMIGSGIFVSPAGLLATTGAVSTSLAAKQYNQQQENNLLIRNSTSNYFISLFCLLLNWKFLIGIL